MAAKTLKMCPHCRATVFTGPVPRGSFVNGKFQKREDVWSCIHGHEFISLEDMDDHELQTVEAEA